MNFDSDHFADASQEADFFGLDRDMNDSHAAYDALFNDMAAQEAEFARQDAELAADAEWLSTF